MSIPNLDKVDALLESALLRARVPGAVMAIVAGNELVFARGYGCRDLDAQLPMTVDTVYPIASTSKAINATLLAILVDSGRLDWDTTVQKYLPRFRLHDPVVSPLVTVRDLVAMRTGMARHDLVWYENPISRADLADAMAHLPMSGGFRERFQYNNLTVTLSAHIAELVAAESWEDLVQKHILDPLQMSRTGFALPAPGDDATVSYHENRERKLIRNHRIDTRLAGPAGGTIHSTITDMTRWVAFNLTGGEVTGKRLLAPGRLRELYAPCIPMGNDPAAPSPNASYGLGWASDTCHGRTRISHGGDLNDVISCVTLYPEDGLGIVSFVNLAVPRFARTLNQCVFNLLVGLPFEGTLDAALRDYAEKIKANQLRQLAVPRVHGTSPTHALDDYTGTYRHPGYGQIDICRRGHELSLERNNLKLALEHWHYDCWVVALNELFQVYKPHVFDRANRIQFAMNADGEIAYLLMQPEPSVAPIRFEKQARAE